MTRPKKVIIVGLDGFESSVLEPMMARGELPNLAKLRASGTYGPLGTTLPAQTPVAFSTFATGMNPGGHGIFDFVRRDPATYLPDLSLNRYEQKNAFVPPRAVNLRHGEPVWDILTRASVPATVLRCPCTYPPDETIGRTLSGMGVPDLRGGLGTSSFFTTKGDAAARDSEIVAKPRQEADGSWRTKLTGPRRPGGGADLECDLHLVPDRARGVLTIRSSGEPSALTVEVGKWSGWLKVRFKAGLLTSVRGMVRFHLVRLEPELELYASPVNFQPSAPLFPISSPAKYAADLESAIGTYYTTGMVEDHNGLENGRFDEAAFLDQCETARTERRAMMIHELERLSHGLFFCLFDTPDRVAHMLWRFREPGHPANREHGMAKGFEHAVEDEYRKCDEVVGTAMRFADDDTLLLVMSDHGFGSFQRGVHLNTWLHSQGLLVLEGGRSAGADAGDLLRHVDWSRSAAYALGLGSIYLNRKGRESKGILDDAGAEAVSRKIVDGLTGLRDDERGCVAVRGVSRGPDVYRGAHAANGPDLVLRCARGYRASWTTALGGVPAGLFEDNVRRWSGDHIVDPDVVPGILFSNRRLAADGASLLDLAPTIAAAFGQKPGTAMEGRSLLP